MLVYRLEAPRTQEGPYHLGHVIDVCDCPHTPTPSRDGLSSVPMYSEWRYGFISLEAFRDWFPDKPQRERFLQYNYVLSVYEVDPPWIEVGTKQVAFHKNYARFQYHIPLREYSDMSKNTP